MERTYNYEELSEVGKKIVDEVIEKTNGLTFTEVKAILTAVRREVESKLVVSS